MTEDQNSMNLNHETKDLHIIRNQLSNKHISEPHLV